MKDRLEDNSIADRLDRHSNHDDIESEDEPQVPSELCDGGDPAEEHHDRRQEQPKACDTTAPDTLHKRLYIRKRENKPKIIACTKIKILIRNQRCCTKR